MEICEEFSLACKSEEIGDEEIREISLPKQDITLERLCLKAVDTEDLISENLDKLKKALPDKKEKEETKQNKLRLQLEGLGLALTAYKLKDIKKDYLNMNRRSNEFIEIRYLSNLLRGINKTLASRWKKPKEIRDIMYSAFLRFLAGDNTISKKEKNKLDPKRTIYNSLVKKFVDYEHEKVMENIEEIGKVFEYARSYKVKQKIEEEIAKYPKLEEDQKEAMKIRFVADRMVDEGEQIRDTLSRTLTDKFK